MYSWKTALITLVIFGLGGLAGSLITARVIKNKIEQVQTTFAPPDIVSPDYPARVVQVMEAQLQLSPEQVKRARVIVRQAQQEVQRLNGEWQQKVADLDLNSRELVAARQEWRLKSRQVFIRADQSILDILRQDQYKLFEEYVKRRRALMQKNRGPGGPRPGDGPLPPPRS